MSKRDDKQEEEEDRRCDRAPPSPNVALPSPRKEITGPNNHFHPGPRVLFVLFPTPWVPPLFPDVPPPNDLHAANRQNEPIIAAFVIFPSTSSFFSSSSRRRETRIVIVFPICIDWIPRSSPARFFLSRRENNSPSVGVPSWGHFLLLHCFFFSGNEGRRGEDDSQRNGHCRGWIFSILRFGRMDSFLFPVRSLFDLNPEKGFQF